MLHDITSGKDDNYCIEYKRKVRKKRGVLRFLAVRTQEGGGGSFRCVLCATGGMGGSKNREKMRT